MHQQKIEQSPPLQEHPPRDFDTSVVFSIRGNTFWAQFDISCITGVQCGGALPGWVLTTDSRRPCHRWGDSETHLPCAPYWPALATNRWAAHVWTRTAPSERKGAREGPELWTEPKWRQDWKDHWKNDWWELCPSWQLMNSWKKQ